MTNGLQCYICNGKNHRGIKIKDQYICGVCENEIINTQPGDGYYEEYKDKIKKILFK